MWCGAVYSYGSVKSVKLFSVFMAIMLNLSAYALYDFPASATATTRIETSATKLENVIRCLYKDDRGFTWFGTPNGLYRYDGIHTLALLHDPERESTIPDNDILSIAGDTTGRIWLSTPFGAGFLNPENLEYTPVTHFSFHEKTMVRNIENRVFLAGARGVQLFKPVRGTLPTLYGGPCNELSLCGHNLVIASGDSLILIHPFTGRKIKSTEIRGVITAVRQIKNRVVAGTWGNGIVVMDTALNILKTMQWAPSNTHGTTNIVNHIEADKENLWISTESGLYRFDPVLATLQVFNDSQGKTNIFCSLRESGRLWFSSANGLSRCYPQRPSVKYFAVSGDIQQAARIGRRWFFPSWYGNGLLVTGNRFIAEKIIRRIPPHSADQECGQINNVSPGKNGEIWVSTLGGISVLDKNLNLLKTFVPSAGMKPELTSTRTSAVFFDGERTWIANYHRGVDVLNRDGKLGFHLSPDKLFGNDGLVWCFFKDRKNRIWIGGNSGLMLFENGKVTAIPEIAHGHSCSVRQVAESPGGTLWLATDAGLISFNPGRHEIFTVRCKEQYSDHISAVCCDPSGFIWYSNENQVFRYDPELKLFFVLSEDDGLDQHSGTGCLQVDSGRLIIGQKGKIGIYDLQNQPGGTEPIKTWITSFRVNDEEFRPDTLPGKLVFSHDQNRFRFEFIAPCYQNPESVSYYFIMEGLQEQWTDAGKDNQVSYAGLSPGKYCFRLFSMTGSGLKSPEYQLSILIKPPFRKTWWFILIVAASLTALVVLIYRFRINRIIELQNIRNNISRDLHDEMGSSLSAIAMLSSLAGKSLETEPERAGGMIGKISEQSDWLNERMHDIVWNINPENDNMTSLVSRMRAFTAGLLEAAGIAYRFEADPSVLALTLNLGQRHDLLMIFKESLNNVIKYAGAAEVTVKLEKKRKQFLMEIADNGKGFDPEAINEGNGLANMRKRALRMGAAIEVLSSPGKGTIIRLRF